MTSHAGAIATMIVVWMAGLTGILVTTAPEESRALWRWSTRPRRQRPRGRSLAAPAARGALGVGDDVVDSRQVKDARGVALRRAELFRPRRVGGPQRERPGESGGVEISSILKDRRVGDEAPLAVTSAPEGATDPLVEQAAVLLAKAMVTSRDRDLVWERFRELVGRAFAELEEAPARDAVDEMERRGLSLDVVARVVQQRLGE